MAKSLLCRIGLAQISVNPAYTDELVSWTQEPNFPSGSDKVGLFSIAGLEEIAHLQRVLGEKYVAHLNRKIEAIVRFAAKNAVELLVFPEYSVPAESLPLCHALSEELGIAIIAGSHVITVSESAQQIYRTLDVSFEDEGAPEEHLRQAASIVFVPKERPRGFVKYVRSKWELGLTKGKATTHAFQMSGRKGRIEVELLICIEALAGKEPRQKHHLPHLSVITSFSPNSEPFYDEGNRNLRRGKCTLFVNVAEFGGSKIFARAERANLWFTEKDGTKALSSKTEALLIVEADLEKQFEVRQLVTEHTAVADVRVFSLLYPSDSESARRYSEIFEACSKSQPTLSNIAEQVAPFTSLNSNVFPDLLQAKLSQFSRHVAPAGIVSFKEALDWITPVEVPAAQSTNALRWELCNQAMDTVNSVLMSGSYVHKTKELMEVYSYLINSRNHLAGSIQLANEDGSRSSKPPAAKSEVAAKSPLIDRAAAFDKIRQFFDQNQNSVLILGGMRGIGKSALTDEAFRQAMPPWKRIWLQLTEGISYQRLLALLAFECNLQLPENLDLSASEVQAEVQRRILAYLGQGLGAVIVLDEFQFLLNPSAEIDDPSVKSFLQSVATLGLRGKSRLVLISHVFPRLGTAFDNYTMSFTLHGLESADTRRLFNHWVRFERDDLSLQAGDNSDRLIGILGGHPLATKLAARLWANHPTADIAQELAIFKELRDTIVVFIVDKLVLSASERELLSFASIFRVPAPREVFLNWRKEDASLLLSSLAGHYLIESSDRGYQLHPLVRSYFGNGASLDQLKSWHKIAAKFYLQEFERLKASSKQIVPEYLGEAVHHFLAAGERNRVQDFAFYGQELRPVALEHFRSGEHKIAMKDYQVLLDLDKNDIDAHYHLSLIFAGMGRWPDAEHHFGKAISIRKTPWILQGFGKAKLRANKIAEGEDLLLQAEKINPNHSATLVELGRLRESQRMFVEAEDYYRRAINADPNNSRGYYLLARLLYREGEIHEAYRTAVAAVATNPTNPKNKELVEELKRKIAETAASVKRTSATLVRVRCTAKKANAAPQDCVIRIGGVNSTGKHWCVNLEEAVKKAESGQYAFFVENGAGTRTELIVGVASGKKYLRAKDERDRPLVLLSLPDCE